jgi:cytoskeleton protein RodZ
MSLKSELTIRHNYKIAAVTCGVSLVLALAWLGRAISEGTPWDWFAVMILGLIGGIEFATLRDARLPLLVADEYGVRLRHGDKWSGLPWDEIERVQVRRRAGLFRDGSIRVEATSAATTWSTPLSLTTTATPTDLVTILDELAAGRTLIEVEEPVASSEEPENRVSPAETGPEDPVEVSPGRPIRQAARLDQPIRLEVVRKPEAADILVPRQRAEFAPSSVDHELDVVRSDQNETGGEVPNPNSLEVNDGPAAGKSGPRLLGSQLKQARLQTGLSIAALSERTQIRAHVLESMEADDFSGCGGDFYARGHLRTVCRRLGLDADHFVAIHDAHYAQAPIEVRQVFESELSGASPNRVHHSWSAPRWGLLMAAILGIGSVWVGAQLLGDQPTTVLSPAPNVVDSVGLSSSVQVESNPQADIATLTVKAVGVTSDVVVRDKNGRIVWADRLKPGQSHRIFGYAPFNVAASRASGVHLRLLGKDIGPVAGIHGGADRTISLPSSPQPSAR